MVSKKEKYWVLWPKYFDSGISLNKGRRVPRSLAVSSPKIEEISHAAKLAGLSPTTEGDKAHPSSWWDKQGRVLVPRKLPKTKTIKMVAEKLKDIHKAVPPQPAGATTQKGIPPKPGVKFKKIKKHKFKR